MGRAAAILGWLLGGIVWLWVRTLRVRLIVDGEASWERSGPRVLAFFHGQQMALLAAVRRPTVVLVSRSRDGETQSRVMRLNGLSVLRGSSSRGAAGGLRGIVRAVAAGKDVALAVDGPRGPKHRAKPGAAFAALQTGAPLLPLATAACRSVVLDRAWDDFEVPLPFSTVSIVVGAPVDARSALSDASLLSAAVTAARRRAVAVLEKRMSAGGASERALSQGGD